jgi:pentatricopeptide repeat protein
MKELRSRGVQLTAQLMSTVLKMGIENGQIEELKYYLNCISYESVQPDNILYNLMVQSYTKIKDLEGMDYLYDKIISSTDIDILDTSIFNCILNACAELSDVDRGNFYWSEMVDLGIPPDYYTYAILIKLYSKQNGISPAAYYFSLLLLLLLLFIIIIIIIIQYFGHILLIHVFHFDMKMKSKQQNIIDRCWRRD